ncbi:PepSY domain-containing protein [Pseudomonas aeruginosa]|uniref:PepSY domain-containing protein n=1 Tax=Pseudomonas aeruginosa TaxID=287 RepID=UPI003CC5BED0
MRADFIRIYKSVHTWTGIISGMALFIAFYAGALTVFKEPLARWVSPPSETRPVPLSETPGLILEALARAPP